MATGRILIVDDDAFVLKALRRALMQYDLELAQDGEKALEILGRAPSFDLILCDLMMPDVSGMDIYEHLRRSAPGQEEKIVFLTGGAVTEDASRFVARIANSVLEKPFDYHRLRGVVEDMLGSASGDS